MRAPTEEEAPYADYVEEIEGIGDVFVVETHALTQCFFVGAFKFDIDNVMGLRKAREVARAMMRHKTVTAACRMDEDKQIRFARFMGFREGREYDGCTLLVKVAEPYT